MTWVLYNNDNEGRIVLNPGAVRQPDELLMVRGGRASGATGYVHGGETNVNLFMHGLLGKYANSAPFKCPADKFVYPGTEGPLARSYAMNNWMNGLPRDHHPRLYERKSHLSNPVGLFVFIHEDPNTIDDGTIAIDLGPAPPTVGRTATPPRPCTAAPPALASRTVT